MDRRYDVTTQFAEATFRGPDGTEFAYVEAGEGPPIVLLHGWSSSLRWWNRNIEALAERHRVLALDFRGHGSSEKTASGHTMPGYAKDVHDFVAAMRADGALLVGWSMGSIVLWHYVMQFGAGQASAMAFVGQSASDLTTRDYPLGILNESEFHQWMHDLQGDRRAMTEGNMKLMVKHEPSAEEVQWMTDDYLRCPAHIATVAFYHQTMDTAFPAFKKIDFPTQVHFGTDPKMYNIEQGHHLEKEIPGTELVIFEESGHVPMWEEPEFFNRVLMDFAQRVMS
jgi:pimeloyl-ACP methyl ester carboxylesterase